MEEESNEKKNENHRFSEDDENHRKHHNTDHKENHTEHSDNDHHKEHHEKNEVRIDNSPDDKIRKFKNNTKSNPWIATTVILGIVSIVLLIMFLNNGGASKTISGKTAGEKLVEYLNARTGGGVEYVSHDDLGNLFEVVVLFQGQNLPVYITKDGEYFIQGAIPIEATQNVPTQQNQPPQDVVKSDKPKVELFIMTHCPYGTQAEKGILPVYELLGNKIDSNIKFIHYFMHEQPGQEPDETPVQICIREEQSDKYIDYLTCFLEDDDSDRCLTEVKIDKTKLNTCKETKYDDYYAADSALSQGYGVQGSPTLIINGQQVSSSRSPSAFLATICSAFNTPPEECEEVLSTANPSAGFGYTAQAGGTTNSQC